MMQWNLIGNKLVGPIEFDTRLDVVKELLGEPTSQFKRTPDSEDAVVAFDTYGVHLVFDKEGLLAQLTVFPENKVYIGSIQLLNNPIDALYLELRNAGISVEYQDAGLWCEKEKVFLVEVEGVVDGVEIYRE